VSGKQQNVTTIRAAAPHVPQPAPACRRKPAPRRGQIKGELTRPARSQVEPNQRRRWGQFRVTRPQCPVEIIGAGSWRETMDSLASTGLIVGKREIPDVRVPSRMGGIRCNRILRSGSWDVPDQCC
jgi:hypothetical protein